MEPPHLDLRARRRQRIRNALQGILLLGGMVMALAVLAWIVLGSSGLLWVLILGTIVIALQPRIPTQWTLSMYGARPLPPQASPELHRFVHVLARRAGLSRAPALYYVASPITNAFAVGHGDDTAIALTDGLLRRLTARHVVAVLAHEISHIRGGDTSIMSLSDAIGRLVEGLCYVGILGVFLTGPLLLAGDFEPLVFSAILVALPTVVTLLQLALSRSREYDADLEAAALTGDPGGLAEALEALERADGRIWERTMVPHGRVPDPLLLRTHPPTAERARRLRALLPRDTWIQLGHDRPVPPARYPRIPSPPRLRPPGIRW